MSGLHGHLDLLAAPDANGDTILRRQSFAAPVHISKPHRDNGWLVVNMASPSPGLLAGDCVAINVHVASGARLLLTAPSASRIHTMREGESASVTQRYCVESGGFLDVWPEYAIPQRGSSYRQKSHIEVAEGGTLLWTESIAPGRTAHGEVFAFREMRIATDIIHKGRPLVRERYRLSAESTSIQTLRQRFPTAYYASVVCISPALSATPELAKSLTSAFASDHAWLGCSQLAPTTIVAKIIAPDSPTLRALITEVRTRMITAAKVPHANIRRTTGAPISAPAPFPPPNPCSTGSGFLGGEDRKTRSTP